MKNILNTVTNLYKKSRLLFIGSIGENGFPNIKMVFPVKGRVSLEEIYISTNTSSKHVAQYRKNSKACVYFFKIFQGKGVLLTGTVEVIENQEIKNQFWRKGDTKYYPEGMTSPDYCILKFKPLYGRYYHKYKSVDFDM